MDYLRHELFYVSGAGGGLYGGDDSVIYWKCEANQTLKEKLLIPVTNMAKERALILAAQQVGGSNPKCVHCYIISSLYSIIYW